MAEENGTQWYDGLGLEAENIGVIQSKGWNDANSIIKSYRDLEKFTGHDKSDFIAIPKVSEGETPDYSEVYARLGRPDTAEGYELADSDFSKAAREVLFKAGITKSQAKELETWLSEYTESTQKALNESAAAEAEKKFNASVETLKKNWGADFEKNQNLVKVTAEALGITTEEMDALGAALGADRVGDWLLAAAQRTDSESPLRGYRQGGSETKEMAALKIAEMNNDPEVIAKLSAGDTKVAEEFKRLAAIMAGGK